MLVNFHAKNTLIITFFNLLDFNFFEVVNDLDVSSSESLLFELRNCAFVVSVLISEFILILVSISFKLVWRTAGSELLIFVEIDSEELLSCSNIKVRISTRMGI